jgi:hypothetical protein
MAVSTAVCNSFKKECLDGVHQPGDTYKIALIKNGAVGTFDKTTANYSDLGTDEVAAGGGYAAGGAALANRTSGLSGDTAYIDFDNAVWPTASISAIGALIYNATRSNKAVQVIAFADTSSVPVVSTNADFTVTIPSSGTGQVRLT